MTDLLVFGVDGLNHDLIQELGEEEMPNFHKLQNQEKTVYGEFESFICDGYDTPHTGPMWTTLYTGLKPQEHGLISGGWNDGDSKFHVMNTVWDKLSEETDKEMILYGMPMTYKAKKIQGEMVSGFISTTLKSLWGNCVYPDSLQEKLPENFIEKTSSYVAQVKTDGAKPDTDTENFWQTIQKSEKERAFTFVDLYNEDSADILAYGTTLVDKIGHVAGISKDSEKAVESYKLLDEILGLLLETLKPEDVAIVSDHGFSEYSHDLNGYALDTSGNGLDTVFDFTPYLCHRYGLQYDKKHYGPTDKDQDLSAEEVNDIKNQLDALGYF
jgi:predicted AlkP superfamily phosphohydrolase/phosphomutase